MTDTSLARSRWPINPFTRNYYRKGQSRVKSYLVGGAVRDRLLGLDPKERDWVVVGESPESMVANGFTAVGQFFPVFLHPDTKEEYALARLELHVQRRESTTAVIHRERGRAGCDWQQ